MEYIKRIVAEPGDVLELTEDGVLLVNGEEESGRMTAGATLPASDGVEVSLHGAGGLLFCAGGQSGRIRRIPECSER